MKERLNAWIGFVRVAWLILTFFVLVYVLPAFGQEKTAEKIDIANIVSVLGDPYPEFKTDDNGKVLAARMVCQITVRHKDKSVYTEFNYSSNVNVNDDMDVLMAIRWGWDKCRDRVVEIVADMRRYSRTLSSGTVKANSFRRKP